ncbi:MAG TPA: hypothetical protein VIV57_20060 [Anaeromyxobacter sp.]
MAVLRVLNVNGDERVEWDPAVADDRMRRARLLFEARLESGWLAYEAGRDGTGTQLQGFDREAGEIVLQPPIAGG